MRHNQGHTGTVYLVGAGPGDPELITAKGLRLLQQADVVVYDRLVHPSLIEALPPDTERIFVGKAPGQQMLPQEGIHILLIERALQGYDVVRLKGGDPFVFGRGGEECKALSDAGIPFEIVPGISSAIAVPAYAGIPVTHRGLARGFSVITGYTKEEYPQPDWSALARTGTLVILMGLRNLSTIVRHLLDDDLPADTPVAIISHGSTIEQQVVEAPLSDIVECSSHMKPPATIVIGEVVNLRRHLSWFFLSEDSNARSFSDIFTFPDLHPLAAITQSLANE